MHKYSRVRLITAMQSVDVVVLSMFLGITVNTQILSGVKVGDYKNCHGAYTSFNHLKLCFDPTYDRKMVAAQKRFVVVVVCVRVLLVFCGFFMNNVQI